MAKTIYDLRRQYKKVEDVYAALKARNEEFARHARELSDDVTASILKENGFEGSKLSLLPVLEEMRAGLAEMLGRPAEEDNHPEQTRTGRSHKADARHTKNGELTYTKIADYVGTRPMTSEQIYEKVKVDFPHLGRQQFGALLAHAAHQMRRLRSPLLKVVEKSGKKLYCSK